MTDAKLLLLRKLDTIKLCTKKVNSVSFKNIINKICLQTVYLIYMYKEDLALDNLQW